MSDATAAPAAPAPVSDAPATPDTGKPAAQPATPEEVLELMLEEGKPAVKVPVSKIPIDKLQPHLAKYRSETDRLRSEYDKNAKALQDKGAAIEKVLKALKEDTDGALTELGIDPDAYAEKRLHAKVQRLMREEEEKADPSKKSARERDEELDRLKKDKDDRDKRDATAQREQLKGRLVAARDAVIAKLPEGYRDGAGPIVLAMFRQAMLEKKDIGIEDAAKAVLAVQRERARAAYEKDEDLRKLLGAAPAKPAAAPAKVIEHPATKPAQRDEKGKFKPLPETDAAGDVLMRIQRGQF